MIRFSLFTNFVLLHVVHFAMSVSVLPNTSAGVLNSNSNSNSSSSIIVSCGPRGSITIDGSPSGVPAATAWANHYQRACNKTHITVTSSNSEVGAQRVCAVASAGRTVDVSILSRPFLTNEATTTSTANGFNYKCAQGDTSRTVIQQKIAMDAIVLAVAPNGSAAYCLQHLYSNGLTLEQLRFLYSNYTVAQLLHITSLSPTNSPSVNIGRPSTPVLPPVASSSPTFSTVKPTLAPLPPYSVAPGKATMPPVTLIPVSDRPTTAPSVAKNTPIPTFIPTGNRTPFPTLVESFPPTPHPVRRTPRPTAPKRSPPSWLYPKFHQHRDSEVAASAYCNEIQALVAGPPTTSDIFQQFVEKMLSLTQ